MFFTYFNTFNIYGGKRNKSIYSPYINYDWSVSYLSNIAKLNNTGTSGVNAEMFTGRGFDIDSVSSQGISNSHASSSTSMIYFLNGVATYTETPFDLTAPASGIYQNVIYFNTTLTSQEQSSYTNSPHTFLYKDGSNLASDSGLDTSKVVAWFPMTEDDGYVRDMVGYSESSELVINGTFDTDTNWTKQTGWSISNGVASCDGTNTSLSQFYQNINVNVQNKIFLCSIEASNYQAGSLIFSLGGTNDFTISDNGIFTFIVTETISSTYLYLRANAGFIGNIDNISVKELSSIYPITNYTTDMPLKGLNYGLQTAKLLLDDNGVVVGKSDFAEFYGDGYVDTYYFLPYNGTATLEFIVKIYNDNKVHYWLGQSYGNRLYQASSNYCYLRFANKLLVVTPFFFADNEYVYFTVKVDNGTAYAYINGVEQTLSDYIIEEPTTTMWIGGNNSLNIKSTNSIRLFKVHDKVLTQEEITKNYNDYVNKGLLS